MAKLLPDAARQILRFYPLTLMQIYGLLLRVVNIMMLEGRMVELEAFSIYQWGMSRGMQSLGGVPQEFSVANNLGVAYINQKKFVEAERIFADLASRKTNGRARLVILNNYAFCLVQNKKTNEAGVILGDRLILDECKRQSQMALHLLMVAAMNALEMGKFAEAETFTTRTADLVKLLKEPAEMSAACEAILAAIRARQRRFEESKLHYANALDILEAADNPDYLTLANHYRDYAVMLADAGESLSAVVAMTKSKQIFELYVERESYAASLIANRLDDSSDLLQGINLITIADRIKYIDVLKT
ncbi:MAG: tetratricopeptide repeat protein [Candidatus Obscuribacterales bacterium]|nr:tetratricopeptide repeat protein [Candidatus Obscuribacterales bacterium]